MFRKVLGHIKEGADTAYVLARVTVQDPSISVTAVRSVTLKLVNGQWRAQFDESAKAMLTKRRRDADARDKE